MFTTFLKPSCLEPKSAKVQDPSRRIQSKNPFVVELFSNHLLYLKCMIYMECIHSLTYAQHYTTLHFTTLPYTTLHSTALHYFTLHFTQLKVLCTTNTTLHPTSLQQTTFHYTLQNTTPQFTFQHFPTPFIIWSEFVATSSSALHLPPRCRTVIVGALLYLTTLPHFKLYAALPQFATWCPTLDTMVQHLGPGVIHHAAAQHCKLCTRNCRYGTCCTRNVPQEDLKISFRHFQEVTRFFKKSEEKSKKKLEIFNAFQYGDEPASREQEVDT